MQRFMVVDDSRAILSIICRAITAGGYCPDSVHAVLSAQEALEQVDTLRPHLIITDWHMPGMSGLELVQTLRQRGYQHIKVGMVTTEMSEARLLEAHESGVEFVLHKPFKDSDLLAAIAKSVGPPSDANVANLPNFDEDAIASCEVVAGILNASLMATPFSLSKADRLQLDPSLPRVLVGLYSKSAQKSVDALCIMDMASVGLIGSSVLGYRLAEMRSALLSETAREAIVLPAARFLKDAAALFSSRDNTPYTLLRSNVLASDTAPLKKALQRNSGLQTYELQVQGLGRGRFVLMKFNA